MRILFATIAAASLLTAGAGFAEPDPAARAQTPQVTHEMCKSMMGAQMAGRPAHDHGKDKTGAATPGAMKPPTADEMAAMHKRCQEQMAGGDQAQPK